MTLQQKFYTISLQRLRQRWKSCSDIEEDFVEKKKISLVKVVPVTNVNFIVTQIIVTEKKQETILSYRPSCFLQSL